MIIAAIVIFIVIALLDYFVVTGSAMLEKMREERREHPDEDPDQTQA